MAPAQAQSWPLKPIRLIVPFSPGGVTDAVARLSAEWLGGRLGQSVVVENKPGANGAIAADYVAHAPADGYTLLTASLPQMAILPQMTRTPYDPRRDFALISIIGANMMVLAAGQGQPFGTLQGFIDEARRHPGALSYASAGSGTVSHLTMALLLSRAGIQVEHVSYKGGGPALADVLAGHIPMYFANVAEVLPHLASGRLRLLAVSGEHRAAQLPQVPTVAESGFPGFHTETWNGLAAPAHTPVDVIGRLAAEVAAAARDPGFAGRLSAIGVYPVGDTPEAFAHTLEHDVALWGQAVRVSGARVE